MRPSIRFAVLLCTLAAVAVGQNLHPIGNIFDPKATPADEIFSVSKLMLAICAAIFIVVAGLQTFAIIKFRRRSQSDDREPAQVYGSTRIEIAWTVLPILIVIVLSMATARSVIEVQNKRMPANALNVTVVGHQWWWEFRYPELGIVTANELHVLLNTSDRPRVTALRLESADVAHSFWVPQLAGKTDLIPGIVNTMWIDPKQEGTFLGNCAEYCGAQHANMLLRVIVDSQVGFEKWAAAQRQKALDDPQAERGRARFLSLSCVNCHTVSGTGAAGTFGPDLTHLMSRGTLGSGIIPNTPKNLRAWMKDPQQVKKGNLMPNMQLNSRELDEVVSYLSTLK